MFNDDIEKKIYQLKKKLDSTRLTCHTHKMNYETQLTIQKANRNKPLKPISNKSNVKK